MGGCTSNQDVKNSTKHPTKETPKLESPSPTPPLQVPLKSAPISEDLSNFPDFFYLDRSKGSLYQITKYQSAEFPLKTHFNLPQDSALIALPNGLLVSVGGLVKQSLVKLVFTIDLQSKQVSELPSLPIACKLGQLHPIGDFIYFIGGIKNGKTELEQAPLMRYNFRLSFWEDLWRFGEQFQFDRIVNMGTCAFGSKICLIGGQRIDSNGLLRNNKKIYSVDVEDGFKVRLEEKIPFKILRPVIANGRKNAVVTGGTDPKTGKPNRGSFLIIAQNAGLKIVKINNIGFDIKENYPPIYEQDTVIFISRPFIAVRIKKINNWIGFEITGTETRKVLTFDNDRRPEDASSDESINIDNASKVDIRGERQVKNEEIVRYSSVYSESPRKSSGSKMNTERKIEDNEKGTYEFPNISEIKKYASESSNESDNTDKLREYTDIPKFVPVQLNESSAHLNNQRAKNLSPNHGSIDLKIEENSQKDRKISKESESSSSNSSDSSDSESRSIEVKAKLFSEVALENKPIANPSNIFQPPVLNQNPTPMFPLEPLRGVSPIDSSQVQSSVKSLSKSSESSSRSKSSDSSNSSDNSKSSSSNSKSSDPSIEKPVHVKSVVKNLKGIPVPVLNLPNPQKESEKISSLNNENPKTITISSSDSGSVSSSSKSSENSDDLDIFTMPAAQPTETPLIIVEEQVKPRQLLESAESVQIETEINIDLTGQFMEKEPESKLFEIDLLGDYAPSSSTGPLITKNEPLHPALKPSILDKPKSLHEFPSIDINKASMQTKSVQFKEPVPPQYPSFSPSKKKKPLGALNIKKLKPLAESRPISLLKSPSQENVYFRSLPSPNLYKNQDFGEFYSKTISSRTNLIRNVESCASDRKNEKCKFKSQFYFSEENVQKLADIISTEFQVNRVFCGFLRTAENFKKLISQLVDQKNLTIKNLFNVFAGIPLIFGKKDFNDKQIGIILDRSGIQSSQSVISREDFVIAVYKAYKIGLLKKF